MGHAMSRGQGKPQEAEIRVGAQIGLAMCLDRLNMFGAVQLVV